MFVRSVSENEGQIYNDFVSSSCYSSIYQSFEWGTIRKYDDWDVIKLIAVDADRIVGALSCLYKKSPLFSKRIFYIPRGPVLDYKNEQALLIFNLLFVKIHEIARKENALYIRMSPDISEACVFNGYIEKYSLCHVQYPILHTATFRLDLSKTEEQLLESMEGRVRYDIRKAEREQIEIISDDGSNEFLSAFYNLLKQVSERNQFPIYSYEMMKNIWDILSPKQMCRIFLARHQGKVLSGAFLFLFGTKCVYQWGGSGRTKTNPNQLMHWNIIRWAKSNGFLSYDFQGVPENVKEGDDLWGIYLFKRGFGGQRIQLIGEYDSVLSPVLYRFWQMIEPKYPLLKKMIAKMMRKR
ncbi:MAG: peptidoglycan bridge formation glycyltransferase FemA/FemB family protein [Candidatus Marinimicrobia bacterium]|nr:peptidoglycan bridge formation glycyltransferase FemA/FemB family protein [Candidatus Neomarinimicrobiota bacterium]